MFNWKEPRLHFLILKVRKHESRIKGIKQREKIMNVVNMIEKKGQSEHKNNIVNKRNLTFIILLELNERRRQLKVRSCNIRDHLIVQGFRSLLLSSQKLVILFSFNFLDR